LKRSKLIVMTLRIIQTSVNLLTLSILFSPLLYVQAYYGIALPFSVLMYTQIMYCTLIGIMFHGFLSFLLFPYQEHEQWLSHHHTVSNGYSVGRHNPFSSKISYRKQTIIIDACEDIDRIQKSMQLESHGIRYWVNVILVFLLGFQIVNKATTQSEQFNQKYDIKGQSQPCSLLHGILQKGDAQAQKIMGSRKRPNPRISRCLMVHTVTMYGNVYKSTVFHMHFIDDESFDETIGDYLYMYTNVAPIPKETVKDRMVETSRLNNF